jgi:hypothetical protein
LLLDTTHKKWAVGTLALGLASFLLYLGLRRAAGGEWTGGSTAGLWFGIAAAGLMVFAGLLAALRKAPSWWWLGTRKTWLRGHIWFGLLSGFIALLHSGFRWGGYLEQALWVVLLLTLVSGVFGLILQQFLPRLITLRVQREAPYEQIPHLCVELRHRADKILDDIFAMDVTASQASVLASQTGLGAKMQLQQFYETHVRPYLSPRQPPRPMLANPLRAETAFARIRALPGLVDVKPKLIDLEDLCEERRQLAEQERLHQWLHAWLLCHIPLSAVLLVLGVAHVVSALYY